MVHNIENDGGGVTQAKQQSPPNLTGVGIYKR